MDGLARVLSGDLGYNGMIIGGLMVALGAFIIFVCHRLTRKMEP